jgi:WD40 repeat protein
VVIKRRSTESSAAPGGDPASLLSSLRPTRRAALAGGLGITALIALPDVLAGSRAYAAQAAAGGGTTAAPHFFLYGTTGPGTRSGVEERLPPAAGTGSVSNLVTGLDLAPVKSPDGSVLALVSTSPTGASRTVTMTLVDTQSGATTSRSTLALPGASSAASILTRPVFAGSETVVLLMAVSEPSEPRTVRKNPATGRGAVTTGFTWTTNHQVAYFDRAKSTFSGPYPMRLGPNPYLALTDAAADSTHLYLWAVQDYSRIRIGKGAANPSLNTQFFAIPLGSGTPAVAAASPGPWPSGAGARILSTGHVARVLAGRDLEVYSPADGSLRTVTLAPMHEAGAAKPGAVTLESLPDGNVLITNSALGRATVVDPAAGFATAAVIDYPRVPQPVRGASVSSDGSTLYTLGARSTGGVNGYKLANGALITSYTHGESYTGVYQLAGGNLLTLTAGPQTGLSFFTPRLERVATATTAVLVGGVY